MSGKVQNKTRRDKRTRALEPTRLVPFAVVGARQRDRREETTEGALDATQEQRAKSSPVIGRCGAAARSGLDRDLYFHLHYSTMLNLVSWILISGKIM